MPRKSYYRKKRNYRKRTYRRRVMRYRPKFRMYRRPNGLQQIFVKRRLQFSGIGGSGYPIVDPTLQASATVDNYLADGFYFQLNDMPNYAEYTALYQEYKICGIKFTMQYMTSTEYFSSAPAAGIQTLNGCELMLWVDKTNATAVASSQAGWNKAYESGKMPTRFPNVRKNYKSVYFRPSCLSDASQGGTDTYNAVRPQWISTTDNSTYHYGVKYAINAQASSAQNIHVFRVYVTYYVKFRYANTS